MSTTFFKNTTREKVSELRKNPSDTGSGLRKVGCSAGVKSKGWWEEQEEEEEEEGRAPVELAHFVCLASATILQYTLAISTTKVTSSTSSNRVNSSGCTLSVPLSISTTSNLFLSSRVELLCGSYSQLSK